VRALFTADLQLGAGITLGSGEFGPGSRFQDQCDILDRIADLAVAESCQIVFVLGDIFERARPEPHHVLAFQGFVRRLNADGIRVFTLVGNHDVRSAALPSAVEIFGETGCVVALQPSLYPVEDIVIAALPWTHPGNVAAAMPDSARDEVNETASRGLAEAAKVMSVRCETEFPTLTPLLVGHWAISGASLPTGLDASMLREPVIPLDALQETGFRMVAFGHLHLAQVVASEPVPVIFTGSPQVNNWGEAEGEHGVWVWDSAGAGHLRFHVIEDRPFLTLTPSLTEIIGKMAFSEPPGDVKGAVVRVRYTVTEDEARKVDQAAIRRDLLALGAAKVVLRPTVERSVRARVTEMHEDMTEAAALELWLSSQGINGTQADALRAAHLEYVARLGQA
jgi:DNA repair exonuclease SbcCD nuclease subunit